MRHDVFISYSSKQSASALAICAALEDAGVKCWIAERDILPGSDWGASIMDAILKSKAVVLALNADANASVQVGREIERATTKNIPVIPVRLDRSNLTSRLELFLSSTQWLDAVKRPLKQHFPKIVEVVSLAIGREATLSDDAGLVNQNIAVKWPDAHDSRAMSLGEVSHRFAESLMNEFGKEDDANRRARLNGTGISIGHGDIAIAMITPCNDGSGTRSTVGAALIARKAAERGLRVKPWTSASYVQKLEAIWGPALSAAMNHIGFHPNMAFLDARKSRPNSSFLTTAMAIESGDLITAGVFSGDGFLQSYIPPQVRISIAASPMLVVGFALCGSLNLDLTREPVGYDRENEPVYLNDIWPAIDEIESQAGK
ncbi:MAG TPA: TIR domain-containing protein [Rhizomicrobium sp.]|nr:TIR domain-containing protein [Rhizomicrobium sp.]